MRKGYGALHRLFNARDLFYKTPYGAVAEGTEIRFRFCAPDDLVIKEALLIIDRDGADEVGVHAVRAGEKDGLDVYECFYAPPAAGIYFYRFCLITLQDEWLFLVPEGDHGRLSSCKDAQYQLSVYAADYDTPAWMRNGLMYQIFPDRFCRSSRYNLQETLQDERARIGMSKTHILREDWGGVPVYKPDQDGKIMNNDFFGGNLLGIMEKLPYLQELGVTILYLNPIFEAFSSHRYDTADYLRIDPLLGTEADFEALCLQAGKHGMRVILDGVFNHTGSDSIYFNREGRYPGKGAYQGKDSHYYYWYDFFDFPDGYSSWWGIDTLPQVHEDHPDYLKYIITGEDSVVRRWIRKGAAGFRLDVADELPPAFLDLLRSVVKEEDADAVIIGEVWEDASSKIAYDRRTQYFWGNELDSVMNYPLKDAVIQFIGEKISGVTLYDKLETLRENYPRQVFHATMNLLGTHDTARIFTIFCLGDRIWEFSRDEKAGLSEKITADEIREGCKKLYLALYVWAFFPGVPCIYYGDELGMQGAEDPFNRMCFDEKHANREVFGFYKDLLHFRKALGAFGEWAYIPFLAEKEQFGFLRMTDKKEDERQGFAVMINRSRQEKRVYIPLTNEQAFGNVFTRGHIPTIEEKHIQLPAMSGLVIEIRKKRGAKNAYI